MAEQMALSQTSRLPWSRDRAETCRFAAVVGVVMAIFLVPAILIPGMLVPELSREEAERIPSRVAKLVMPPKADKAPEPVVIPEPPEQMPSEPEPASEPEARPEPAAPVRRPEAPRLPEQPAPVAQSAEQARETASRSGLFAMKDRLSALTAIESSRSDVRRIANVDAGRGGDPGGAAPPDTVFKGSGGVEAREGPVREVELANHETSNVAAPKETVSPGASQPEPARPLMGERAMSNIRQVFDAQKGVLYSLYQRELRQDPTLEGKVTLELVIEPDGTVSACDVVGSELGHPMLEKRIALRVQMFHFGADNVTTRKVRFPIDFLPG
ncbi:AgmX/PglI C-terminal domain-containing protein [Marinobacter daepoensis]|uniref:AgmX/PglI C-terminal domain-containing protein n=1 Tax=Marinobacter daepoensis TaxID=262077 RepID=UPI0004128659|nr:AgmX/PglI C-terminal domain-containing protein [Marinobacter daepoensis]